jgi:hypothetical protein
MIGNIGTGSNLSTRGNASSARLGGWIAGAIAGLALLCAATAEGRDWAKEMFDHTTFDFGVVPRGAKVEHRFTIENRNEEEIRIESVESNCHCTTARATKQVLKSWEKAEIVATLDTRSEPDKKDATIEVVFAAPFAARVQLHTHSFIRGDIVVRPGAVQFGSINQGTAATREVKIVYGIGRNDWKIERVECANPHIETKFVETSRNATQVAYDLTVKLKNDAPPGYVQQPLILVTNDLDLSKSRVLVNVEGLVAAALTVRPSSLVMGTTEVGKAATGTLVVQGRAPFRIVAIRATDKRFQCKASTEAKPFHIIPVTFLATDAKTPPGKVIAKIRIETDLADAGAIEVDASIEVAAGSGDVGTGAEHPEKP